MTKIHNCLLSTTIGCLLIVSQITVNAQATRTWVSGVGDDANPCSRTAPCKTFAGAISKTAAGGEISVLDPGGFGSLTITKSITINGEGTLASVLSSGGTVGFTINAAAGDIVTIRNISIQGANTGTYGIIYNTAAQLNIENCSILNFLNTGIDATLAGSGALVVKNTTITSSQPNAIGIDVSSTSGTVSASIDNVLIQTKSVGINASTNGIVTVSNSVINQGTTGVRAQNSGMVNIGHCVLSNNSTGVLSSDAASIIRLTNSSIFNSTTGINGTGKVVSFGNNTIAGNTTNTAVPLSVLKQQ
jgi:hypothetical protein